MISKSKWLKDILICSLPLVLFAALQPAIASDSAQEIVQQQKPFVLKLGASRVIYHLGSDGATLPVINELDYPMLVKTDVLQDDKTTPAPFVTTPPVFRLDAGQQSMVRIMQVGGEFPTDRESMAWVCVKGIPPKADDEWAKKPGEETKVARATVEVQVSVNSCLKLFIRPDGLMDPDDAAALLTWHRQGNQLKATNPTPYYMNLKSVTAGGQKIEGLEYIPPQSTRTFTLPRSTGDKVEWRVITDYGGDSHVYSGKLQ